MTTAYFSNGQFVGPAHKHAHHLHSIPPREKSTRTLIIDHILWVHGRTRFAQARAELGMTDPTGGPSSSNYTHRRRPEEYDEEDEVVSDGEEIGSLKARAGNPRDEQIPEHDLNLARALRLRAEGLEKVVTSMLDQPPPIHPIVEDITSPPTSPKLAPSDNPHTLPNGVRLRLALATIINDLFARQAPPTPRRDQRHPEQPSAQSEGLPPALELLLTVSAPSKVSPSTRTQVLYVAGADPSTANSPPALRCPRHLHTGCDICVDAKSRPGIAPRVSSDSVDGGGISGWRDGSGIGSGLARPGPKGSVLRRKQASSHGSTGAGNTKLSELIPRFLRLSALVAAELGLETRDKEDWHDDSPSSAAPAPLEQMHAYALRPSQEWYMLLAGLLTRAALEGYLTAGWRGSDAVECLMTCGLGINHEKQDVNVDEFAELDPDEFPSLIDSVRVLFPSTRGEKAQPEDEFEMEMDERLRRVCAFCSRLTTSLTSL